jgi:hypothetical protein
MAKPPEDPRITDLRRFRKEREQARKRKPNPKAQMRESFLGANPRAGLILVIVVLVIAALYGWPFLRSLPIFAH